MLRKNNEGVSFCKLHDQSWFQGSAPQLFIGYRKLEWRKRQMPMFCLYTPQFCWLTRRSSTFTQDSGRWALFYPDLRARATFVHLNVMDSTDGDKRACISKMTRLLRGVRNVGTNPMPENKELFQWENLTLRNAKFGLSANKKLPPLS